jgi:acyl-CoA reductase-like NAD-dependent aldehyde dehydrogenase
VTTLANYIDGAQAAPSAGRYLDVLEPATGRPLARAPVI